MAIITRDAAQSLQSICSELRDCLLPYQNTNLPSEPDRVKSVIGKIDTVIESISRDIAKNRNIEFPKETTSLPNDAQNALIGLQKEYLDITPIAFFMGQRGEKIYDKAHAKSAEEGMEKILAATSKVNRITYKIRDFITKIELEDLTVIKSGRTPTVVSGDQ